MVRDALLGRETHDIDLAVACHNMQDVGAKLASFLGGRTIMLDKARNIVRVVVPESKGGPAIDLSPIHDGICEDLSRRDFTLDAMALTLGVCADPAPTKLIDPFHGTQDLRAGVIRAVAPSVFTADPARLMRAPRLAAQLEFRLANETAKSIRHHAHLISGAAPERVRDELLKLLAESFVTSSLYQLDDLGLLCQVIPELAHARDVTQPREHRWDVFNHSIETTGAVERLLYNGPSEVGEFVAEIAPRFQSMDDYFSQEVSDGHTRLTLLKLAGLLHDIAKPATKTIEPSGRIRFLGHHRLGTKMSTQILGRLRLSGRGIDLVSRMVEHHLRPSQMARSGELPTTRAIYRYYRDVGDVAIDTLYLNLADYIAARGSYLNRQEWAEHCQTIDHILQGGGALQAAQHAPKLIDGYDIMRSLSLPPGPRIGFLLDVVCEAQANGEIASREEALQLLKSILSTGGGVA